jgi:hypothetical protein
VATQAVLSVLSLCLLQASKPKIRAQAAAYAAKKTEEGE